MQHESDPQSLIIDPLAFKLIIQEQLDVLSQGIDISDDASLLLQQVWEHCMTERFRGIQDISEYHLINHGLLFSQLQPDNTLYFTSMCFVLILLFFCYFLIIIIKI